MTSSPLPVILLVDGTKSVLEAMVTLLEDEFRTLTASSREEAVSLAHQNPDIKVIVLGIKYPDNDFQGIQIAVEMNRVLPEAALIFHSGYPIRKVGRKIKSLGLSTTCLHKGRSPAQLLKALREAAGKS